MKKKKETETLIDYRLKYTSKRKNTGIYAGKGIINNKKSLYTYTTRSNDGKKQDKRTCVYYDKTNSNCINEKCHITVCTTAHNCTCYKRKEKPNQNLSPYDESYIAVPYQVGIHESTKEGLLLSKSIGTPVHIEYLKNDGNRRHKARCIYYDKINKLCNWLKNKCGGSSHCEMYKETIGTGADSATEE